MTDVALRPSELTLTTVTEKETAEPKPTVRTELGNRPASGEVPSQSNPPKTNYDRWLLYQRIPRGKNARKRLSWRIQREAVGASLELREKEQWRGSGQHQETSKASRKGKSPP
jgi:hypothetical protein